MHHVREAQHVVVALHLHAAQGRHAPDVVAPQVDEHVVLGQLLLVGQQVSLERRVLLGGGAAGARARQREGVEPTVLQLGERLGARGGHLHVVRGDEGHVGRGVRAAKHPVGVEEAARGRRADGVGQHHLEDVALVDVLLGAAHHGLVALLAEGRLQVALQVQRGEVVAHVARQDGLHLVELGEGPVVGGREVGRGHVDVGHEHELLAVGVEHHEPVEQHEVHVEEVLAHHALAAQHRLRVLEVVVGEIAHQAARERREARQLRALVLREQLAQGAAGMLDLGDLDLGVRPLDVARHRELPVEAGQLHRGRKAQEAVAAPAPVGLGALKEEAVVGACAQAAHRLDGGERVTHDLAAHGHAAVPARALRDGRDLVERGHGDRRPGS